MMQVPGSSSASRGMQRMVTFRSLRTRSSTAGSPLQWLRANPPWISGFSAFCGVKKA